MKLSVVIPAHNEAGCIVETLEALSVALHREHINHEIIVVNDHSTDNTESVLTEIKSRISSLKIVNNGSRGGFGSAISEGLKHATGQAIAIFMADASDSPDDLVRFFKVMDTHNVDCVFGTRFSRKSKLVNYPPVKLVLNRIANTIIRVIFGLRYNDITNAFKLYRDYVIAGIQPIISRHFNLTVELPLKAIIRGYSYTVLPNSWVQRKAGVSKLKIKEMGSRYLFVIIYCMVEKWLTGSDYKRNDVSLRKRKSFIDIHARKAAAK